MPSPYLHTEFRDRYKKDAVTGKTVKYARSQIFENAAGEKLSLDVDPKSGKPLGEIVVFTE